MDTNSGTGNENLPPPTLCRTGCGFYGNSQFDGMCSKCYKDMIKKRNQNTSPNQLQGHVSPTAVPATESMSATSSLSSTSTTTSSSTSSVDIRISPNIETASPTVPSTANAQDKTANDDPEGASGGAEASTSEKGDDSPDKGDKKPKKNRCHTCKKKVGLLGFECRCGGLFCGLHRYSDKHECTFNYKELGQEQIRKNNPVVVGSKIKKI